MGAGEVAALAFLSHSGRDALHELHEELSRRGLQPRDLLRLRLFGASPQQTAALRRGLEELLPREHWPAVSSVTLGAEATDGPALDAIAARGAHERRTLVQAGMAVRYGDWVFVGAIAGASEPGLALSERIGDESRSLFERMQVTLDCARAQLRDVVKVGGWLRFPMSGYEPLGQVRAELLDRARLFPASAAVQVGVPAGQSEPLLAFEAIAFVSQARSRGYEAGAKPSSLASYYATARSASGYVFASGEIPRRRAAVPMQIDDVYEQLREHISAHGGSLASAVHQTVYVRRTQDIATVEQGMRSWLSCRPPTTVIRALDIGFIKDADVEIELVARTG